MNSSNLQMYPEFFKFYFKTRQLYPCYSAHALVAETKMIKGPKRRALNFNWRSGRDSPTYRRPRNLLQEIPFESRRLSRRGQSPLRND